MIVIHICLFVQKMCNININYYHHYYHYHYYYNYYVNLKFANQNVTTDTDTEHNTLIDHKYTLPSLLPRTLTFELKGDGSKTCSAARGANCLHVTCIVFDDDVVSEMRKGLKSVCFAQVNKLLLSKPYEKNFRRTNFKSG